jgi:hypothetical protein
MSEPPANQPALTAETLGEVSDKSAGISVLFASLAMGVAVLALCVIEITYRRYRGRDDLDFPDWFLINMDLTATVLPICAIAGICLLVSAWFCLNWIGRAGWALRLGFAIQWLLSAMMIAYVVLSRIP